VGARLAGPHYLSDGCCSNCFGYDAEFERIEE
jgi:hypothetical protein